MHQNRPRDGQLAVGKALATHAASQEDVFEDADAAFGLRAAPLQFLEFPRAGSSLELLWRAGADRVVDAIPSQSLTIGFIV